MAFWEAPTTRLHIPEDRHLTPILQGHLVVHLEHWFRLPPLRLFLYPCGSDPDVAGW